MKLFEHKSKKLTESANSDVDQFIKKGKKTGLQEFDFFDNQLFFSDGSYISFTAKLKPDGKTIVSFKGKDNGNRRSADLKKIYGWKQLSDIDPNVLMNIKEI